MTPPRLVLNAVPAAIVLAFVLVFAAGTTPLAGDDSKLAALLEKVTSDKVETRYAARSEAPAVGGSAVLPLAKLIASPPESVVDDRTRREISLTARAALERIVHHAGRPGAGAEARAVAAELAKLLDASQPGKVRREVLHWIALIGGDGEVPAVARSLDDADQHVRETARLALERIPGKSAVEALVEAARRQPEDRKADLLFSLGKKGDSSVAAFLAETASRSRGRTRLGALEALARIGGPDAARTFAATIAEQDLPERAAVFNEYLRLGDNLLEAGKAGEAAAIHRQALASAPGDHQRERALLQLTRPGGEGAVDAVLAGLADAAPRVNRAALARLRALEGQDVAPRLKRAFAEAKPEARPAILRAIAERDAASAEPLLAEAAASSNAELKITALDIAGKLDDPALEAVYLKTAESGSPQVKLVALNGYLLVAWKRLDGGDRAHAHEMFQRALELAASDASRGDALRGVIKAQDPRALEVLGGLLKDPVLGAEAARGYVAAAARLGASGEKARAEEHLLGVVKGELPRDVKASAVEELRKLGRDPQKVVRSEGFVIDWHLLTPIQDPDGKGLETKYFPEEVIELDKESRIGPRKFIWQRYGDVTLDGVIDLIPSFRRSEKVITYAYTEIDSPVERDVVLKMGSDDGIACFLNGQRIHLVNAGRGLKVDEDSVKARLKVGKNKVLLKISNHGGSWMFSFRLTDAEGRPIDLGARQS